MVFDLILQPRAELELLNAFEYYSHINDSVLYKFTFEVVESKVEVFSFFNTYQDPNNYPI